MPSTNPIGVALLVLASLSAAVEVQAQNLVVDGSFEPPNIELGPQNNASRDVQVNVDPAKPTRLGGWTLGGRPGSAVMLIKCPEAGLVAEIIFGRKAVNYCQAGHKTQYLNLSGNGSGATVFQDVPTRAGSPYFLRFLAAAATEDPKRGVLHTIHIQVHDDQGHHLADMNVECDRPPGDHKLEWHEITLNFRATSARTRLTLSDNQDKDRDDASFIDDVVLETLSSPIERVPSWRVGLAAGLVLLGGLVVYWIFHKRRGAAPASR